jgi:serine/threonine-protein phosphatase 2A activator
LLDDISGVKEWSKVGEGLGKMYRAEVLGKLPITQHLLFGTLLSFDPPSGACGHPEHYESGDGHFHVHAMGQEAPECCNMRIPSAQAGMAAAREREMDRGGISVAGPNEVNVSGPRGKVAETGYLNKRKPRSPDEAFEPMPMPKFQPASAVWALPFD